MPWETLKDIQFVTYSKKDHSKYRKPDIRAESFIILVTGAQPLGISLFRQYCNLAGRVYSAPNRPLLVAQKW